MKCLISSDVKILNEFSLNSIIIPTCAKSGLIVRSPLTLSK